MSTERKIITVIDLAKDLVERLGIEAAIAELNKRIAEWEAKKTGFGPHDFQILCKTSGLQTAILFIQEKYLTQNLAIPYRLQKYKGVVSEIKRLFSEWLNPTYGKEFRRISEDQMKVTLMFLSCFKSEHYPSLFGYCERSYTLDDDNFQKSTVLENPFTVEFKKFIAKQNFNVELTAGMISFIDCVIEETVSVDPMNQTAFDVKEYQILETLNYDLL